MNVFQNMEQHKNEFTQNDLKIYEAILAQPEKVISLSTSDFAQEIEVSQPALTRFIKMLGYHRYSDFRSDITAWSATINYQFFSDSLPYFEKLKLLLAEAEKVLTDDYLEKLAKKLLDAKRIFACGMGKSYQPAALLHLLLRKYGIFLTSVPLDELIETADNLQSDDLLIVFSVSAKGELMKRIENCEAKIMLVTNNAGANHTRPIDELVLLPYLPPDPETSSVSPVLFDIFVELLDVYIAKQLSAKGKTL